MDMLVAGGALLVAGLFLDWLLKPKDKSAEPPPEEWLGFFRQPHWEIAPQHGWDDTLTHSEFLEGYHAAEQVINAGRLGNSGAETWLQHAHLFPEVTLEFKLGFQQCCENALMKAAGVLFFDQDN